MQMPLVLSNRRRRGGSASAPAFSPSTLYSSGSQGVWLDPSDLSTMFSDRAGTTPVTTPGTVVGLRLDKSKGLALGSELVTNGAFATNLSGWTATAAWTWDAGEAKGVLASSGDTLIQTFATLAPGWVEFGYRVTSGGLRCAVRGSDGLFSLLIANSLGGTGTVRVFVPTPFDGIQFARSSSGTMYVDNVSVKQLPGNHAVAPTDAARPIYGVEPKGGRRNLLLATDTLATQSLTVTAVAHTLAFTGTGTVTLSGASIAGPLIGTGASDRVSLTFTPTAASLTLTVVGSVTLGQLELGSSATAYQKVVTAYNVTESGVATVHYVQYDGSDDSMSTAAINFTGTDKVSVFAGMRKLSDAARATFIESSTGGAAGSFSMNAPSSALNDFGFTSIGTTGSTAGMSGFSSPISAVLSGFGDISGDLSTLRVNGIQVAQNTGDQGTGNFSSQPIYFGRRGGTSFPFSGKDYGIIIVGKAASATEISDTETWLAARTSGVSL